MRKNVIIYLSTAGVILYLTTIAYAGISPIGPCTISIDELQQTTLIKDSDCKDNASGKFVIKVSEGSKTASLSKPLVIGDSPLGLSKESQMMEINLDMDPSQAVILTEAEGADIDSNATYCSDNATEHFCGCAIIIKRNNVILRSFSFEGFRYAVCVYGDNVTIKDSTFSKNFLPIFAWGKKFLLVPKNGSTLEDAFLNNTVGKVLCSGSGAFDMNTGTCVGKETLPLCPADQYYFLSANQCVCQTTAKPPVDGKCPLHTCPSGYYMNNKDYCVSTCAANEVIVDNSKCVPCLSEEYKVIKDGKCVCDTDKGYEEWPAGSGTCLQICNKDKTEVRNSDGTCVAECTGANEEKGADTCICKDGFGRYQPKDDFSNVMPCVKCSGGSSVNAGGDKTCRCNTGSHRTILGECAMDSSSCSDVFQNTELVSGDYGAECRCKDGYGLKYDSSSDKAACEGTGTCPLATQKWDPDKKVCFDVSCPAGQSLDKVAGKCVSGPPKGDCGCNYASTAPTTVQYLLPWLLIGLGGIGIRAWRFKR